MMPSPNLKSDTNLKYHSLLWMGSCAIIAVMGLFTWILYRHGIENEVLTNHYQTSILLSNSIASHTATAPYALAGLNWFICKSGIRYWKKWLNRQLNPLQKPAAKKKLPSK